MVDIWPVVRSKAISLGATAWLAALDDLVYDLEQTWAIRVVGARPARRCGRQRDPVP